MHTIAPKHPSSKNRVYGLLHFLFQGVSFFVSMQCRAYDLTLTKTHFSSMPSAFANPQLKRPSLNSKNAADVIGGKTFLYF